MSTQTRNPKKLHYLYIGALLVVLTGCRDQAPSIYGAYTLQSINGKIPPQAVAADASGVLEFTDGTVTLNADHTFSDVTHFRFTSTTGTVTTGPLSGTGTWSQSGNNIAFNDNGDVYNMSLAGKTLTQTEGSITLVYKK